MIRPALISRIARAPRIGSGRGAAVLAPIADAAARSRLASLLEPHPTARRLLGSVFAASPFLSRIIASHPDWLLAVLTQAPEAHLDDIVATMRRACAAANTDEEVMPALRQARQRVALLVAVADLGGAWDLDAVTGALTCFADGAVAMAADHALREAGRAGRLDLSDPSRPGHGCGYVLIAMGKHGARELNYSSDIDLIALHDPARTRVAEGVEPDALFARLTQRIVRLLQSRTADDYVLRVDLRLRPDPGSTPPSVPIAAAYQYYETVGQNWERAAFIKARPVAGDIAMGERFLADLAPFVWRRHLDFQAIAALRGLWRDVRAVHGEEEALEGRNVKLGPGGIRECELATQALQLVFGGRDRGLRGPRTVEMIEALTAAGHLPRDAARKLTRSYAFLRMVEHRLQMRHDEQTQTLPRDDADLDLFGRWCGFADADAFEASFAARTREVRAEAVKAFGERGGGAATKPAAVDAKSLASMGFRRSGEAEKLIAGWSAAPERVSARAVRARRSLAAFLPDLVAAFAATDDPDAALRTFDRAFERMAAPAELFSILAESEPLRRLFAAMLGSAPRLAEAIIRRPHLLDIFIDVRALSEQQTLRRVERRISARVSSATSHEEALDLLRDAGREEWFLAGARFLGSGRDAATLASSYTNVAQAALRVALDMTWRTFALAHGVVPGARLAVIAMGRLGSGEMTASSDLDLIVVYDVPPGSAASDGRHPLDPVVYFSRLTNRLITAISAPTSHGSLYDIDMRLRPSGGKGPVALPLAAFVDYQLREAETWEHLALTRARLVAGDPTLRRQVASAVARVLGRERDRRALVANVREMRLLLAQEKGQDDASDLKNMTGGLIDLDFCAQFLALLHGATQPTLLAPSPRDILAAAGQLGLIAAASARLLLDARSLFTELLQRERLRSTEVAPLRWNDPSILRDIARHLGFASGPALVRRIGALRADVAAIYAAVIR